MTTINDIVLIYLEDDPISFARVEDICPDHKKDWYQIKLLMLQIPLQTVTWILKDLYINGEEFQMGGQKMRLEKVECPEEEMEETVEKDSAPKEEEKKSGDIISFSDLKKHKNESQS